MTRIVYHFEFDGQHYRPVERAPRHRGDTVNIITDEIEPLEHPCTGEMITSKSRFRDITKAHGCEEVGTEKRWTGPWKRPGVSEEAIARDVREAYERCDAASRR
jgi:hypothetical protein